MWAHRPLPDKRDDQIGTIGEQSVNTTREEAPGIGLAVDRPHLNAKPRSVRITHKPRCDDMCPPGPFWGLVAAIRNPLHRPSASRPIQSPPDFLPGGARRHVGRQAARFTKDDESERSQADPVDRVGSSDVIDDGARAIRVVHLQLDDDPRISIGREHRSERRNINSARTKGELAGIVGRNRPVPGWERPKPIPGVGALELGGSAFGDRPRQVCRPLESPIVMDDHDAVAREMHVQLQPIGAQRQP